MRILLLGGTGEARRLAETLTDRGFPDLVLSLAGVTSGAPRLAYPTRIGGFGGAEGLAAFLRADRFAAVVDATHPFASEMTANAVAACRMTGKPLLRLQRPGWHERTGDRWHRVPSLGAAADALGDAPRRVFLTIGRTGLAAFAAAPHHNYLVRAIDRPDVLPTADARVLLARPPFKVEDERALLRDERIDVLVTKDAGGPATDAKLGAARALSLPVVMIDRPPLPPGIAVVDTVEAALVWVLDRQAERGV